MKTSLNLPLAALALSLALPLQAADADGYVDFGTFSPAQSGGQFVEVNIGDNLIGIVTKLAATREPEVAELLGGLKRIRVNVIGMDEANRGEIGTRIEEIGAALDRQGWERIVTVREGGEMVNVYLKTRAQEAVEGVVVTILQGDKEAILVNVVGDIRPEKIAMLGERFNLEPLKQAGRVINGS
jgi:hypothetical protein